jgi:hypothetical protein
VSSFTPVDGGQSDAKEGTAPEDPTQLPPSIERRLSALSQSIRTWDWRTQTIEPAETTRITTRPTGPVTAPAPAPPAPPRTTPTPVPAQAATAPAPPVELDDQGEAKPASASTTVLSPFVLNLRWFGAAAILIGFVVTLVLFSVGSSPPSPSTETSTTTTTTTGASDTSVAVTKLAALSQPQGTANLTFRNQLAQAGTTPDLAQVTGDVTPYLSILQVYEFELHAVPWPSAMSADVTTYYSQLLALAQLLSSITTMSQSTLPAWLAQVRVRATSTQAADNQVRSDLGLRQAVLFPVG